MKKKWSRHWKSSKQPRKQRKYRHNAPLHTRHKFMSAPLSKDLEEKYKKKRIPLRTGDRVKIMMGQFKNTLGKVEKTDLKKLKVYIEGAQVAKRDGTKSHYPIDPSNVQILELELSDKKRKNILERGKENVKKSS